jgi:hypothetical protein
MMEQGQSRRECAEKGKEEGEEGEKKKRRGGWGEEREREMNGPEWAGVFVFISVAVRFTR